MGRNRTQLGTLKRLLTQIDLIVSAESFPESARCRELIAACLSLTDDPLKEDKLSAAQVLDSKGDSVTAKRGPEYFTQPASTRNSKAGGGPRKET